MSGPAANNSASSPSIVAIGGGTGLPVLLSGLKKHTSNLTAVVTVADDGGSSGRLRREIGILPPGDIRNCLVAMSREESLTGKLFQYRFEDGALAGHSFGNLFLAALTKVTGDFKEALEFSEKLLDVCGTVLPASLDMVSLNAELGDGKTVSGQSLIANSHGNCRKVWLEPAQVRPSENVIDALSGSDLIVIGPGSLFTSIIPIFLIPGISEAVASADCAKIFICNVMTQPGETINFTAADHLEALKSHADMDVVDTVLVNTSEPSEEIIKSYKAGGANPVEIDERRLTSMGINIIGADLGFAAADCFRHDSDKLAAAVLSCLLQLQ